MQLNKHRIRRRFAKAAETYDSQAVIQVRMAERLLELLEQTGPAAPSRVLEIGCCTGLLTERLHRRFPGMERFYVNDLVPEFHSLVRVRLEDDPRIVFLAGDIEHIDIPGDIDLVVSSSTLHWLADLPAFFRKISTRLIPGGTLCFSIYGSDNLAEMRALTGIGLDYYSPAELQVLVANHFDILACEDEKPRLTFDDPLAVLNHLRETGVNALDPPPWTRSRLEYFRQEYTARFGSGGRVSLTYHPVYCIARRKNETG